MDDDGLPIRRRHIISVIAAAIISLLLLFAPANVVSYEKQYVYDHPVESSGSKSIAESDDHPELEIPVYDAETERILHAIALCESGDRHFDENGDVLMNAHGSSATGRYQIMSSVWRPVAESMGINIDTEAGNKQMAYHVLEVQGIAAWTASETCLAKHNVFIK